MRLPLAFPLACVSAFTPQAQAPLPEGVYSAGNGVTSPRIVSKTDPQYSEEARIARLTGTVRISLVVETAGTVRDVRATASPGLGLAEKAIEAVSAWRFKPGLRDGVPVPVSVDVEVHFALALGGEWSLARAVFNPPEGATRPVLTQAPYPPIYTPTGQTGSVAVSFDIGPNGVPTNLRIGKSSSLAAESEVTHVVRGWQFQPGIKDGQPVSVRCTMEFVEGNVP